MKYEEELKRELKKYPRPKNELSVANYCIGLIDKHNKLTRYEKDSFSNHLSRIMIESELEGSRKAKEEILKIIKKEDDEDEESIIKFKKILIKKIKK